MKAYHDAKKAEGKLKALISDEELSPAPSSPRKDPEPGRYHAKLADAVDVLAHGDTGADHSVLAPSIFEAVPMLASSSKSYRCANPSLWDSPWAKTTPIALLRLSRRHACPSLSTLRMDPSFSATSSSSSSNIQCRKFSSPLSPTPGVYRIQLEGPPLHCPRHLP